MRGVIIISAAVLIAVAGPTQAQTAPEPLLRVVVEEPAPSPIPDPDPARATHLELANRYLVLTQGGDLIKQMRGQIEDSYGASGMPTEQNAWMTENMGDLLAEVVAQVIADLRDDVADDFTVEELETAIAFYDSPIGRSVVSKQVDLNFTLQETMVPLLVPRVVSLMEKFCARFDCAAMAEAAAKQSR